MDYNDIYKALIKNDNIFQLNSGALSTDNFSNVNPKPLDTKDTNLNKLNNSNIAIDSYRVKNFSNWCGTTSSREQTFPVSFPVITQQYDRSGILIKSSHPEFKNNFLTTPPTVGTGNQNEIGLYFYDFFNDKGNSTANKIDWKTRQNYDDKFESICMAHLESCWAQSATLPAGKTYISDGNSRLDPVSNIRIDDLNLYCPGIGGCYFANNDKAISHSGNAGLVKISCKTYVP